MAFHNLARMTSPTTGTGASLTLGSAVTGFLTFSAAGVVDGETVSYGIQDGVNSEVGTGTYTASGTTLTRNTTLSTAGGATRISMSGAAQVFVTALAADIIPLAPSDGTTYGRVSGAWGRVVAVAGDTMTGALTMSNASVRVTSATLPQPNKNNTVTADLMCLYGPASLGSSLGCYTIYALGNWYHSATGYAGVYTFTPSDGTHRWYCSDNASTANTVVTWGPALSFSTANGLTVPNYITVSAQSGNDANIFVNGNNSAIYLDKNSGTSSYSSLIYGTVAGSPRWQIALGDNESETGSNAGSNFLITSYSDTGSNLSTIMEVFRSSGQVNYYTSVLYNSTLQIANGRVLSSTPGSSNPGYCCYDEGWGFTSGMYSGVVGGNPALCFGAMDSTGAATGTPYYYISKSNQFAEWFGAGFRVTASPATNPAALYLLTNVGASCAIYGEKNTTTPSVRWLMQLGNATAESGSNVGSDFSISNYSDSGSYLGIPLTIQRSNGYATFSAGATFGGNITANTGGVTLNNSGSTVLTLNKAASGQYNIISGNTNNLSRWQIYLGDGTAETGSNVGSNFTISNYNDAGTNLATPLSINRASGAVAFSASGTFGGSLVATGRLGRSGVSGSNGGNYFNWNWVSPNIQAWVDNSNIGNVSVTSDYRTKKDIKPLASCWEKIKALRPISYTQKEFGSLFKEDDIERWGLVAHELQETLIESAATGHKDEENVIQSPNSMTVIAALTKALQEAMNRIEQLEAKAAA